ncbi:MAG TPA: hypothetical protein HPP56_04210 [Nitrospirae bacterium]|nr:hypothetical protein [Nitrospirota bacterium]
MNVARVSIDNKNTESTYISYCQRFSDRLKAVFEEYKERWEELARELEALRKSLKKGRAEEQNFGFDSEEGTAISRITKERDFWKKTTY